LIDKLFDEKTTEFQQVIEKYKGQKGALIPLLQATQDIYGYLSKESMKEIASQLSIPFSEVFGVATFYAQFRFQPRGKHMIRVCSGTACHVRGGPNVLHMLEQELGIKTGETTEDQKFSLEQVACLGACGLAPVMMVDEETYGRLTKNKIRRILDQFD